MDRRIWSFFHLRESFEVFGANPEPQLEGWSRS